MLKKLAVGALALGLFAGLTGGTAYVAFAQADVIKARKDNRQQMRASMGAIKKVMDDKGNAADAVPHATKMVELQKQFATMAMFPAGSNVGETKAAPSIWSDWPGFQAVSKTMETNAENLAAAGRSGDLSKVAAAFGEAGKTCAACHDKYWVK